MNCLVRSFTAFFFFINSDEPWLYMMGKHCIFILEILNSVLT